jgi:hypothetical protein
LPLLSFEASRRFIWSLSSRCIEKFSSRSNMNRCHRFRKRRSSNCLCWYDCESEIMGTECAESPCTPRGFLEHRSGSVLGSRDVMESGLSNHFHLDMEPGFLSVSLTSTSPSLPSISAIYDPGDVFSNPWPRRDEHCVRKLRRFIHCYHHEVLNSVCRRMRFFDRGFQPGPQTYQSGK